MSASQESSRVNRIASRVPIYFAVRPRHVVAPLRSPSEELSAQLEEDIRGYDLQPARLRELQRELELYNGMGRMVTYDKIIGDWVSWNRYESLLIFLNLTC